MYKCETCGLATPEGKNPNHDRACWAGQVTELYGVVNLFVNFDGERDNVQRQKEYAIKVMNKIRAKNDPTFKV